MAADSDLASQVEKTVAEALQRRAAPSASVAIVRGSRLAFAGAFGMARRSPDVPATPETRYAIGSVSKQFTAAAVLMLAEAGELSLDEPISRWFTELPGSDVVTPRRLLNHTAGYMCSFPQRGLPAMMTAPIEPAEIVRRWAGKGPEFTPGSDWRYSNTGYQMAGLIVEAVTGRPLFEVLRERIFEPLGMTGAVDRDTHPLDAPDAQPFTRPALGDARPVGAEASGWLFATAGLAMPASDLALWNQAVIDRALLAPSSYRAMWEPGVERAGRGGYGLGVAVRRQDDRLEVVHGGQISGFLADNRVYPDDVTAITVLCNTDSGTAAADIADRLSYLVLEPKGIEASIRRMLDRLRDGSGLDAISLGPTARAYFDPPTCAAYRATLGSLGDPRVLQLREETKRGGMLARQYRVVCEARSVDLRVTIAEDGALEELLLSAPGD